MSDYMYYRAFINLPPSQLIFQEFFSYFIVLANFLFFVAIHGFFVCNGEEVPGGAGATTM